MNNFQLTKNFNLREFECTCSDNHVKVDSKLVNLLQQLRDKVGRPVVINSAYRCPARNKAVGGASNSQHLYGKAADIRVPGMTPAQVAKVAEEIGFDGIGIYSTFVHVDTRGTRARWNG